MQADDEVNRVHLYKKLAGEYVGWYYTHGFEIIDISYSSTNNPVDILTLHEPQDAIADTLHELIAIKITGDPNVPATKETFSLKQTTQRGEPVTTVGRGQIAGHGYQNPQFIPGQLLNYSPDYSCLVFLFEGLGPLVYFRRERRLTGTLEVTSDEEVYTILRMRTVSETLSMSTYESQSYRVGGATSASRELIDECLNEINRSEIKTGECCAICLIDILESDDPVSLLKNCGHIFHDHCVRRWLIRDNSCPLCKKKLK
ncbi:RING-H2 zinc finger protein RHA1a [Acrasis kona]|uniref:RING-H2 zinc finger protein RHA1a n=1 Tax=Acrasis kona TaxID=1008807 RepID=A0AAW2ZFD8_9EUKA